MPEIGVVHVSEPEVHHSTKDVDGGDDQRRDDALGHVPGVRTVRAVHLRQGFKGLGSRIILRHDAHAVPGGAAYLQPGFRVYNFGTLFNFFFKVYYMQPGCRIYGLLQKGRGRQHLTENERVVVVLQAYRVEGYGCGKTGCCRWKGDSG